MRLDFLIVGQGLSGTFLSWYLTKENKTLLVIDDNNPSSPSRISAGIINPVTGRRIVKTWMIDEIMPFAVDAYNELGTELEVIAITEKSIVEFFPSPQMQLAFINRIEDGLEYLHPFPDHNRFRNIFNYDFNCGEIRPAYIAHIEKLLPAWSNRLQEKNQLLDEKFEFQKLDITDDGVRYGNISARMIIFCDGTASADHHLFRNLPFAFNKGEALIIESDELPAGHIFKKNLLLAPLLSPNHFWLGSSYQWEFPDAQPTKAFRDGAEKILAAWLKVSFRIVDHKAAIRPATIERRPFVGIHPLHNRIGILNGMGTKGASLAPYFANQLAQHLVNNKPIHSEADIARFRNVLQRDIES